jgi:hypothetical protein
MRKVLVPLRIVLMFAFTLVSSPFLLLFLILGSKKVFEKFVTFIADITFY